MQVAKLVLLICMVAGAIAMTIRKGALFFKNGAISVLMDYLQMQGIFWSFNMNWPNTTMFDVMDYVSLFNINWICSECSASSPRAGTPPGS